MAQNKKAATMLQHDHGASLVPSDTRILANYLIVGTLGALTFVGIPAIMAVFKLWGWY